MESLAPHQASRPASSRKRLSGWWGVAAITGIVAVTWIPAVGLRLGDSHEGRILGRFALHVRNFWEMGPLQSGLASNWEPMYSAPYAHHPPLTNALMIASSAVFGHGEVALRVPVYLAGVLSIVALAAFLRAAGMSWGPILLSIGALAATPFFWVYGRLGLGFVLLAFLATVIVKLRNAAKPSARLVAAAMGCAFLTALGSWEGTFAAALLGIWLWRGRGLDRPTIMVGLAMVAGLAASLAWISYASGLGALTAHAADRASAADFTWGEWIVRQGGYAARLVPWWYLALAVPSLAAGLADRRTRVLALVTLAVAVVFGIGLAQNAWIHEYWNYLGLASVTLGGAALADWVGRRLAMLWQPLLAAAFSVVVVVEFVLLVTGPLPDRYFGSPANAGRLAVENPPPADQTVAWVGPGIATPRWLAYYWDLPARGLDAKSLDQAESSDLMVVKVGRFPEWMSSEALTDSVAQIGDYAVVRVGPARREVEP